MTIKANVDFGVVSLAVGDNTVIDSSARGDRYAVTAISAHNTGVVTITVTFYESPDATSASGEQLDVVEIGANEQKDINGIIGQGYTQNIIAVPSTAGVNIKSSGIDYTGSDV